MLTKLFPESIFPRKLSPSAERRMRLAQARGEEAIIRAHVDNALMFVDTLAEEVSFDRAIDTYIRVMGIPEPLASTVATRSLVALGQDLVPYRKRARDAEKGAAPAAASGPGSVSGAPGAAEEDTKPRLRLNDASEARARAIKRA
jgi:hypothetical protein